MQQKQNDCPIHYAGKGYAKLQAFRLFPIVTLDFVRFVVRDTGNSAMATRGKGRINPTHSRYY